jgi:hypothetical protein
LNSNSLLSSFYFEIGKHTNTDNNEYKNNYSGLGAHCCIIAEILKQFYIKKDPISYDIWAEGWRLKSISERKRADEALASKERALEWWEEDGSKGEAEGGGD